MRLSFSPRARVSELLPEEAGRAAFADSAGVTAASLAARRLHLWRASVRRMRSGVTGVRPPPSEVTGGLAFRTGGVRAGSQLHGLGISRVIGRSTVRLGGGRHRLGALSGTAASDGRRGRGGGAQFDHQPVGVGQLRGRDFHRARHIHHDARDARERFGHADASDQFVGDVSGPDAPAVDRAACAPLISK